MLYIMKMNEQLCALFPVSECFCIYLHVVVLLHQRFTVIFCSPVCSKQKLSESDYSHLTGQDDPITNAGRGSNLTESGHVECDASIMDGITGSFGAVGAIRGTCNNLEHRIRQISMKLKLVLDAKHVCPVNFYPSSDHSFRSLQIRCKESNPNRFALDKGSDCRIVIAWSDTPHVIMKTLHLAHFLPAKKSSIFYKFLPIYSVLLCHWIVPSPLESHDLISSCNETVAFIH